MKKEEISILIDSIHINSANLEYIASTGKINGTLRSELERIIQSLTEPSSKRLDHICRSIVNGLYELAELDVKKRQDLNDRADEYVLGILESLAEPAEATNINAKANEINPYKEDNIKGGIFNVGFIEVYSYATQSNAEAMREHAKKLGIIKSSIQGSLDGIELFGIDADVIEKSHVIGMLKELKELID